MRWFVLNPLSISQQGVKEAIQPSVPRNCLVVCRIDGHNGEGLDAFVPRLGELGRVGTHQAIHRRFGSWIAADDKGTVLAKQIHSMLQTQDDSMDTGRVNGLLSTGPSVEDDKVHILVPKVILRGSKEGVDGGFVSYVKLMKRRVDLIGNLVSVATTSTADKDGTASMAPCPGQLSIKVLNDSIKDH